MAEGSSDRIRVLIADDHRMFRDLLRRELSKECDIVGEATDGESTLAIALRSKPQVVLLDVVMRGIDGLSAAHELARKVPDAKVLILSQYENPEYVLEALKEALVAGYFSKLKDSADNILPAIRAVHAGGRYLSPSIAPIVLHEMNHPSFTSSGDGLTKREREVLRLVAEGCTTKEIATRLNISPKTAQVHRDNLKQKLNLHSTAAIVRYAIERKMIRVD
jgi:NarL family two-component system response regulator LiaR